MTGPPLVSGFDNHCAVASTGFLLLSCVSRFPWTQEIATDRLKVKPNA